MRTGRGRGLGLSLIEAALALGVAAVAMAALMQVMGDGAAQVRARATADRMVQVVAATRDYVRVHHNQLVAAAGPGAPLVIPVGKDSAGGTVPSVPSGPSGLPSLQGGGFLPSTYVDVNPYGQRHAVLVRETGPNRLEVMVTTHGGRAIRDGDLGRIASRIGAEGGFMMAAPPDGATDDVQGAYGGWRAPASAWANGAASPSAGHVMAMLGFDNGTVLTDFLYRYDIGVPEANRMHAAIDMNGNDLDNVSTIKAVADLLRVEQDLQVARDAEIVRDLGVGGGLSVTGDSSLSGDVAAGGKLSVEGTAELRDGATVTGEVAASGRVAGSNLLPQQAAVAGSACAPSGLISRDSSGKILSCVAGAWAYPLPNMEVRSFGSYKCPSCDVTYNLGEWDYCALSQVYGPGSFTTDCLLWRPGKDWLLRLYDRGDSGQTHGCSATCFRMR